MEARATLPVPVNAVAAPARNAKAWRQAQDFEAQFLKTMLEQAYAGISGEGPLGGAGIGAEAWRSFLIDEHARAMAATGGIGLAAQVYRDIAGKEDMHGKSNDR